MSGRPTADEVCAHLTPFQRRTVAHVMRRFHGPDPGRRFLVADETGLGKSVVARGVVARTIEQLEHDEAIDRIDVVYVCSNLDLAQQNLKRLNVTGGTAQPISTRLTLLARESQRWASASHADGKPVNLVSFTPGTSFSTGWQGGTAQERALLHVLVDALLKQEGLWNENRHRASLHWMQGGVSTTQRFAQEYVAYPAWLHASHRLDGAIVDRFARQLGVSEAGSEPLIARVLQQLDHVHSLLAGQPRDFQGSVMGDDGWSLLGQLRTALARAGVDSLEPDLIILDEFQRFRELLDPNTEAGELADALFSHPDARVLLLSATPYKPFTFAEEDEDHEEDFLAVLNFLAAGGADTDLGAVREGFEAIRSAARRGQRPDLQLEQLSGQLRRVMTRWERPTLSDGAMHQELVTEASLVTAADLRSYTAAHRVAGAVSRPRDTRLVSTEYWKSAPHFLNFCAGYKLGDRLTRDIDDAAIDDWPREVTDAMAAAGMLTSASITAFKQVDAGNARMRVLLDQTVDQGWWKLLWLPPTLPYVKPQGVFAEHWVPAMTKRLVFSSWSATPTAVASLVSYEAERRMAGDRSKYTAYTPEGRRKVARTLGYSFSDGRPANMTTLLMMWPLTRLSELGDVRAMVADSCGAPVDPEEAVERAAQLLRQHLAAGRSSEDPSEGSGSDALWRAAFGDRANWPDLPLDVAHDSIPAGLRGMVEALTRSHRDDPDPAQSQPTVDDVTADRGASAAERHVRHALASLETEQPHLDDADARRLARVALFAPGCVALRVLRRLMGIAPSSSVSPIGLHVAATMLANAIRSLFQRPEVVALLDQPEFNGGRQRDLPYWEAVLRYCEHGNLEAVLDEWLFHVWADQGQRGLDDEALMSFVQDAAGTLSLRAANYSALSPSGPHDNLTFTAGLAARYGGRAQKAEDARQPQVRAAFNSPFWPFVLASTSVGQEGVDFHWWCHAVFHWNTPPNPVDFEQREGRVDRFHGHAVRKNIVQRHASEILADGSGNPWVVAYAHADAISDTDGFAPDWVYPGDARIERHVAPIPFSTERAVYERVKQDVAFYRVALGQPRQEDMLDMMRCSTLSPEDLRLDLRPPAAE